MKSKFIYFLFFFFPVLMMTAQESGIKGTVTSSDDGLPLPGATVTISGTNNSTSTDFDGKFSLQDATPDAALVVSFVGYATQTISLKGQKSINIVLKVGNNQLNEIVVTGYSKQKKADITGSVAIVNVKDIMKQPEPNPIKALQGRVAGVRVSSDGSPSGGNTKVVIRGVGTLNNTDPLYVIDGMPTKSGMHELNANDIESIQILKDAASASIYGSRASNGVIIITTKKGKEGKMRINFNTYTSLSDYTRKLSVMNANQFGQALWQANINDGLDPNNNHLSYQFDWSVNNNKPQLNKVLVPEYLDAERTMKSSNTDWYDAISQTGVANS
ncbi:TonB-dependent receptor plug domain-containing protein, partial [Flavobacterium sp.]|uniref:TonB-dependent receptor plug domain-containing protein n=1 Tax=Flavobacterium sp. TaxID=239 RepID=UPI002CF607A2